MSRKVISVDNKIQLAELDESQTIPIGASFTEITSAVNTENENRGVSSESRSEIVVMMSISGTMPAGSEIVITPVYHRFGEGSDVTTVLGTVTDDILVSRIENDVIRDSDWIKVTYRFQQGGATYDVDKLYLQIKKKMT